MNSEVYNQSICMMNKVAYSYYIEKKSQSQIANELQVSKPTISRILKKSQKEGVIQISMNEPYRKTILLEKQLKEDYGLAEVIVVPPIIENTLENLDAVKKQVALEGARYVQRIIQDGDNVGLAWGGTMYYFIQYLNPCRKVSANMITMHGDVDDCDSKFEAKSLVKRAAMAFGGHKMTINHAGYTDSHEQYCELMKEKEIKECFGKLDQINISVTGIGSLYPDIQSPIKNSLYITENDLRELREKKVRGDMLLRFIDENGEECDTGLKNRTLAITLETYKKIPCKILLASGKQKSVSVKTLIKGNLVDVLIVDYLLAEKLL